MLQRYSTDEEPERIAIRTRGLSTACLEEIMARRFPGRLWKDIFAQKGVVRSTETVGPDGFTQYVLPCPHLPTFVSLGCG